MLSPECILILKQLDKPAFFAKDGIIIESNQLAVNLGFCKNDVLANKFETPADNQNMVFTNRFNGDYYTVSKSSVEKLQFYILEPSVNQEFLNTLSGIATNLRSSMSGFVYSLDNIKPTILNSGSPKTISTLKQATRNFFSLQRSIRNMSDIGNILKSNKSQKENVNLTGYFSEQVEKLNTYLNHSDVNITCTLPEEQLFCAINKELMERALYNMVSNSLNAGSNNIHIELSKTENRISLTVSDDGTGMNDEQKANILRKFQKTPSLSLEKTGAGFGMLIVHATAVYHNGTILITDADPKGCKVTLTFDQKETTNYLRQTPALIKSDSIGGTDHLLIELANHIHPDDFM